MTSSNHPQADDSFELLKLYQDLVETSQDLIWQCDVSGRYTYLNPAWEDVFGYTIEEMIGRKFTDFQDPNTAKRDMDELGRLLEGGTVKGYETIHIAKSGRPIHLSFNAKYFCNKDGVIEGTRGTAHDITERVLAERSLRESEIKFATAFQDAPVLISITDMTSGAYIDVNEEALRISGFNRDEVVGKTAVSIGWITKEQREILRHAIRTFGRIESLEMNFRRKDGSTITGIVKGELINLAGKDCLLTVTVDITCRKRTEEALRQSEERFRTLFMSISDGFYLSEIVRDENDRPVDYRYLEVNPKFEQIAGLRRDQIVGRRYKELVPVDSTKWLDNYFKVALTGKPSIYEFYSDEYQRHFETYSYKTAPEQISVFVRDVTDRKNTEDALRNIQKLESLGVLAGGIAHDFNNLLGGIFGFIDLAMEEVLGSKAAQYLGGAMNGMDRARNLTRQLLTFSKGGVPEMKLAGLFPFVYETAKFALSGANVSCECVAPENLWACDYDRNQMGRVIDNMVINAQQAMPEGGLIRLIASNETIVEGAHPMLPPGPYVRISIQDRGIGMPKDMLSRIFDPFYTTKSKGHGLGLTVCYSIVSQHHGVIDVESEPGKGTTFHILIPAVPEASIDAAAEIPAFHWGNGTAIVMDDEVLMQKTLARMVESYGYRIILTSHGDEALNRLHAEIDAGHKVAFMMVDLTVPGGRGGNEIIKEIRKKCPHLKVFVVSGYADDPVMACPTKFGFTASLRKPFRKKELTELLETHLTMSPTKDV
jgi:PAS domain S-box-containing protein